MGQFAPVYAVLPKLGRAVGFRVQRVTPRAKCEESIITTETLNLPVRCLQQKKACGGTRAHIHMYIYAYIHVHVYVCPRRPRQVIALPKCIVAGLCAYICICTTIYMIHSTKRLQ